MITQYSKPQFLSRIFTDAAGRQFRLTFLVAVVDGELKGHLVSAEPISATASVDRQLTGAVADVSSIFCLPIACPKQELSTEYVPAFALVVSPYFSAFEFLIHSQPTRAPSRRA